MGELSEWIRRLRDQPSDEDWKVYADWLQERSDPWWDVVAAGIEGRTIADSFQEQEARLFRIGKLAPALSSSVSWGRTGVFAQFLPNRELTSGQDRGSSTEFRMLHLEWFLDSFEFMRFLPQATSDLFCPNYTPSTLAFLQGLELHGLALHSHSRDPLDLTSIESVGPLDTLALLLPVTSLEPLTTLPHLRRLDLGTLDSEISLAPLSQSSIYSLRLTIPQMDDESHTHDFGALVEWLEPVERLPLRRLSLTHRGTVDLSLLPAFHAHSDLQELTLHYDGLEMLPIFPKLKRLVLRGVESTDLQFLRHLPHLESLDIRESKELASVDGLEYTPRLRTLHIEGARRLHKLGALRHVPRLERLELRDCPAIETLEDLSVLHRLRALVVHHCGRGLAITPVLQLNNLGEVSLVGCRGVPKILDTMDFRRHVPASHR
ncbi:MAG: hypothetical protein AAGA48_30500 [Myxococcota bacterium]